MSPPEYLESSSYIFYIPPHSVRYISKSSKYKLLDASNWDARLEAQFSPHESIKTLALGLDYRSSHRYRKMLSEVCTNGTSRWCKSISDIDVYFQILQDTWSDLACGNYRLQSELPDEVTHHSAGYPSEILVSIGRQGKIALERGGTHRLSMAFLSTSIKYVPVSVVRWHPEALLEVLAIGTEYNLDRSKALQLYLNRYQ